jgi:hypothetical protein
MKCNKGAWVCLLALVGQTGYAAETAELRIQFVGIDHPTSFPKLLQVHIANPAYTPLNLTDAMASSELVIDGKPSKRTALFQGPPGIPPVGEWEGCLSLDDYAPAIAPGKHKVALKLGIAQSDIVPVRWEPPVNWRKGNLKSRMKEIQDLAAVLVDGLPQDCVERWLTVKDGGLQEEDKIRYFLEPEFKAVVPYRKMYQPSGLHAVVDGPVQVYKEAQAMD